MQVDFPEVHPLCKAREISGVFVRFCLCMTRNGESLCDAHRYMREVGKGKWDGFEVTLK